MLQSLIAMIMCSRRISRRGVGVVELRREDRDRIEYVGAMLGELQRMTDSDRAPLLRYLIEMACIEARTMIEADKVSGNGRNKRDAVA